MTPRLSLWIGWLPRAFVVLALLTEPAVAGPPFVSDDPEPTDTGHFVIYTFNYGAAPNLQLTATLPAGYSDTMGAGTQVGPGNVELAAKYRFLHQDTFGLDVSVFPRVFLPSGSATIGDNHVSLLLPIWVQKDF